jgi:hypothetical protein
MSNDGAKQGVGAERALHTILGGAPEPGDGERETVGQMRARILAAPINSDSYDGTATACARLILEAVATGATPLEPERDLYDRLKAFYSGNVAAMDVLQGLTLFMWGWAHNAARRCLDAPSVPNPAIMELWPTRTGAPPVGS